MNAVESCTAGGCRSRLIEAGMAVFLEEGYAASVDRIAARAGVAKQTVYNHFPCKADLFGEVVKLAIDDLLVTLDGGDLPLRDRLLRFGLRYRERLLSTAGLGFFRTLVAETNRFPELAAAFYNLGPARTEARVAAVLAGAMDRGELRRDEPTFTATLFLSMLVGTERSRCLLSGEPSTADDPDRAARIVDAFLRAYAP